MQLESLLCNHCGAPLQVPPDANFVICASCGSQLAVKRTPTVVYTEVLRKLDQRTRQMAADLRDLRLQSELEQVDREWEDERQQYLARSRSGWAREPTRGGAVRQGILMGVFSTSILC